VDDPDRYVEQDVFLSVGGIKGRLAGFLAEDIHEPRRADGDVGDIGIGDHDRMRRGVQPQQRPFIQRDDDRLSLGRDDIEGPGRASRQAKNERGCEPE